jgi:hypothetical protein
MPFSIFGFTLSRLINKSSQTKARLKKLKGSKILNYVEIGHKVTVFSKALVQYFYRNWREARNRDKWCPESACTDNNNKDQNYNVKNSISG